MGARIRIPLRVLLACLAVSLVAIGAAATGLAEVSATRGYLMRQADTDLLVCARSMLSWRVVLEAVQYQPQRILYLYGPDNVRYVISGRTGHGPGGVLVVMAGLAGISRITERVAAGYAGAAGAVLVLLAGAALALARAILRPLREAPRLAEAAGQAAAGELIRASRTAEAAACRSAAEMAKRLGEVSLDMRTSVNVVRGSAAYYRQRRPPLPADLDRMMRRVADEAARLETLIEDLSHPARTGAPRSEVSLRRTFGVHRSAWP